MDRYSSTCIPSLLPPGADPSSIDFRTFFPYIPNEVKHRKRTSRTQLKVLEDTFRRDTKPNAALRKKLAAELDMLPRAVQVWFQNRRAKDKALRKRVQDSSRPDSPSPPQKSPSPRDPSPDDSSHSSTPTEKPTHPADHDDPQSLEPHPVEQESSPLTKLPVPPQPPLPWHNNPSVPSPHLRPPPLQVTWQDTNDLLNSRRGSLPITMSIPSPDLNYPPTHFPDRRKSMDVNFLRLMHHPFARVAKEKNDAIFHRSHSGLGQLMPRHPSGLAAQGIRTATYGSSSSSYNPYPRPPLAHRASEPHVLTPMRSSTFPNGQEAPPSSHMQRRFDRPFATSSRALSSPIPGPLPKPDFQFGAPSSVSPSHASPDADSPNLHTWAFPRNETDQDTEDSASSIGLSRFGSIASACGSDTSATSAIYSDVSSCVGIDHMGFDPHARRGSCASNSLLETRMSGLNMRSSQGSINEAHLKAASSLVYPHREHLLLQERGYTSPASTVSPAGSPQIAHGKDPSPFSLRTNENAFGYNSVPSEPNSNTYLSPTEPAAPSRRPSIPTNIQGISRSHIQNTLEPNSSYPPPIDTTPSSNTYHFNPESSQYSHAGNYVSSPPFARDSTFSPTDNTSYAQPGLQYTPEGSFPPPANVAVTGGMGPYVPHSAHYSFTAPPVNGTGHSEEHFYN